MKLVIFIFIYEVLVEVLLKSFTPLYDKTRFLVKTRFFVKMNVA
ncbi:hypothetical protein [Helicobacter sp. 16-1353]|nr:hypothetical protein [Helicobacter sp. 16-1353]